MPILVVIVYFALAACMVIETGTPPSAPLPKPTVYVWAGPGPSPSVDSLAQDKVACAHDAEQKVSMREVASTEALAEAGDCIPVRASGGVPESVAMKLTGHKTRSVFLRYDIVDDKDLNIGVEKLAAFHAQGALRDNYGTMSVLPMTRGEQKHG